MMLPLPLELYRELEELDPTLRRVLIKYYESIKEMVERTVQREDFLDLKNAVKELTGAVKALVEAQRETKEELRALAEVQRKTDERLNSLTSKVEELAEAQKRTDEELKALSKEVRALSESVRELTESQKRTDEMLKELISEQAKFKSSLENLQAHLGGLTQTLSYAFENEAYRNLPKVLKEKYNFEVIEKFIRTYLEGEEINFLARAKANGKEVYLVGESKIKFEGLERDIEQLKRKVRAVKKAFGEVEVIELLVTHFATPRALERAKEEGIIVVQSFEW